MREYYGSEFRCIKKLRVKKQLKKWLNQIYTITGWTKVNLIYRWNNDWGVFERSYWGIYTNIIILKNICSNIKAKYYPAIFDVCFI